MRVARVVLARHGWERVAQVAPIPRKTAGIMSAGPGVVVERTVMAVARDTALLLQLHQGLDLMVLMVGLGVGAAAAATAVRRPAQVPEIQRGGD